VDLTNDATLATIAEEIEVFRRAGMFSRIKDLNEKFSEHIEAAMERIKSYSGEIAELLEYRLGALPRPRMRVSPGAISSSARPTPQPIRKTSH